MSNIDRIEKFFHDQLTMLSSDNKSKARSEIQRLKDWLIKHQDETVPDGTKGKILSILERYNRAAGNFADLRKSVEELFSAYLQLPEGKLLSAKDKSKVLKWYQQLIDYSEDVNDVLMVASTRWTVELVDESNKTVTLLSTENAELWKEDVAVTETALFNQIKYSFEINDVSSSCLFVEIDESGRLKIVD